LYLAAFGASLETSVDADFDIEVHYWTSSQLGFVLMGNTSFVKSEGVTTVASDEGI